MGGAWRAGHVGSGTWDLRTLVPAGTWGPSVAPFLGVVEQGRPHSSSPPAVAAAVPGSGPARPRPPGATPAGCSQRFRGGVFLTFIAQ